MLAPEPVLKLLRENDVDDVVHWAYHLNDPDDRCMALRYLLEISVDPGNEKLLRLKALYGIKALPPHGKEDTAQTPLPVEASEMVLVRLMMAQAGEADPELKSALAAAVESVRTHYQRSRERAVSVRITVNELILRAASFDAASVATVAHSSGPSC